MGPNPFPFLSVIVALYQEPVEEIDLTMASLTQQSYPSDRHEILFTLEPGDYTVIRRVAKWLEVFHRLGVEARIVYSDGLIKMKPHALNRALAEARGDYCAFYDAGDRIDHDQLQKAVSLMAERGYDVCQARVLRNGSSLLSRLLLLDTCVWYWKYLPVLLRFCGGFPLSGEGLFVRKAVLTETSGFPEVLTEDALLGLQLTARAKRFGLLDSTVTEKAPRSMRAHFRQKLRWYRGYLTCLRRLMARDMPRKKKVVFALPLCAPIASGAAFWGWLFIIARIIANHFCQGCQGYEGHASVPYYWAVALACVGIPIVVISSIHALRMAGMVRHAPMALFLPMYWMFIGVCATCALFRGTTHWARTER